MERPGPGKLTVALIAICALQVLPAFADEGGIGFWLPGQYGSFAAVAPTPGWSVPLVFYNYGGSIEKARLIPRGHGFRPKAAVAGAL